MPRKRKTAKRRASTHRRRRDPVATATSRHRRKPARRKPARKPARRRASGFSLRDFLGLGTATSKTRRRKPAKKRVSKTRRAAKRRTTRRDWPGAKKRHAAAAKKGWRTGHKKAKKRAKRSSRDHAPTAAQIRTVRTNAIRHWELERKVALKYGRKADAKEYAEKIKTLREHLRRGR